MERRLVHGAMWGWSKSLGYAVEGGMLPAGRIGLQNASRLGRLSGVGLGDVFAVHGSSGDISKGGTTLFTPLPGNPYAIPFSQVVLRSFRVSALRFGDFDGNGVTDVVSISGGIWSISWDARATWHPLGASCFFQHGEQALVSLIATTSGVAIGNASTV